MKNSEKTQKNSSIQQKRLILLDYTRQARAEREKKVKEFVKKGDNSSAMEWAQRTLNSIIIDMFYKKDGNIEFKHFKGWKSEDKKIIKGSKGFVIWGRPLGVQKKENDEPTNSEEMKYFPISHVFSNKQVTDNEPKEE